MVCVALLLHGLGFGGQVVAGFVDMHREAVNNGFPDNLDTYGMVSGMWTSMFALGAFAGPSLAGAFYDHFGFRNATLSVIVVHIVLFIVLLVFLRHGLCHSSRTGRFHKLPPSPPISRTPAHQPAVNGEAVRLVKCSLDSTYGSGVSDNSSGPEICVC